MKTEQYLKEWMKYVYDHVKTINDSKLFAGLVILTLNLSSKLITLPMSKTVESIVKHNFSKYVLVFAISWMGTREIFVALFVTIIFAIIMEFLFNEQSAFCCLSEGFVTQQLNKLEEENDPNKMSPQELEDFKNLINKAQNVLNQVSPTK